MKRIFTMIVAAAAVCVAALALSSCKEDNLSPDPGQEGQQTFPDPLDHSDAMFQINWTPYKVEQGGDGVSIEVTSLSEKDFTFVCRPGSAVKAFKVAAFPLSELYNMLINLDWTGGITDAAVENALRSYIDETSSGGTTGYIGGADITYGVVGDDDNEMEFVWSQAGYTLIPTVVPDAEYIIIAQGYYEYDESTKEADTPAGLSLCYVRTPHKPLVGNPEESALRLQTRARQDSMNSPPLSQNSWSISTPSERLCSETLSAIGRYSTARSLLLQAIPLILCL